MSDIDALPAYQYHLGQDPIDVAIQVAGTHIEVRDEVLAGRAEDATTFPGYGTTEAERIAARIIGDLLGAGWKPPTEDETKAAAAIYENNTGAYADWLKAEQERIANGDDEPPALEAS